MRPRPLSAFSIQHSTFALLLLASTACSATPTLVPMQFDTITTPIKGKVFTLEVADTEPKRDRGLMYRESMPADHGMIFVFDTADKYGFWMKNTDIPLDIVYLNETGKVVDIRSMRPHDETPTVPESPALFAIELNAGTAKSLALAKGDQIDLPQKILKHTLHSDEK